MTIKGIIKKVLRHSLPESIHLDIAKKEEEKRISDLKENSEVDQWLKDNKDIHKGERCFILATGPSLNKLDLSKIKNEYTIGVNGIYKLADEIDLNYFIYVSNWYWKNHVEGLKNLNCDRKFLPTDIQKYLESEYPTSWINVLRPQHHNRFGHPLKAPSFFSNMPEEFFTAGGSVVFLALQLAYNLGFDEVILLGLDHTFTKDDYKNKKHGGYRYETLDVDKAHFDKNYNPKGLSVPINLEAMENGYQLAKDFFEKNGRKILNASPGSMLDTFKKVEYDSLF